MQRSGIHVIASNHQQHIHIPQGAVVRSCHVDSAIDGADEVITIKLCIHKPQAPVGHHKSPSRRAKNNRRLEEFLRKRNSAFEQAENSAREPRIAPSQVDRVAPDVPIVSSSTQKSDSATTTASSEPESGQDNASEDEKSPTPISSQPDSPDTRSNAKTVVNMDSSRRGVSQLKYNHATRNSVTPSPSEGGPNRKVFSEPKSHVSCGQAAQPAPSTSQQVTRQPLPPDQSILGRWLLEEKERFFHVGSFQGWYCLSDGFTATVNCRLPQHVDDRFHSWQSSFRTVGEQRVCPNHDQCNHNAGVLTALWLNYNPPPSPLPPPSQF
jgi:hypothetical protein